MTTQRSVTAHWNEAFAISRQCLKTMVAKSSCCCWKFKSSRNLASLTKKPAFICFAIGKAFRQIKAAESRLHPLLLSSRWVQPVSSATERSLWVMLGDVHWNGLLGHGSPLRTRAGLARVTRQQCCTQRLGFIQSVPELHPWQRWLGSVGETVPRQVWKVLVQERGEMRWDYLYKCKAVFCLLSSGWENRRLLQVYL